jgi:imidazolonepropionase-like amidohydrolase
VIVGGRDAGAVAGLLAERKIPVIYEATYAPPGRDDAGHNANFKTPQILHQAGVMVAFSIGTSTTETPMGKNLPYHAAQCVAYGLPEDEAVKGLTLYPAQLLGVSNRLGSIEVGKEATLFMCNGNILDIRSNVQRLWIAGKEINLENRHTRLYQKYQSRPRP